MNNSEQFAEDVKKGLSQTPKRLPSKYFYDEKGSRLFQRIMDLDVYYLTDAEKKIFQTQGEKLANHVADIMPEDFQIIELGAGDARKTELFLRKLDQLDITCTYRPVDLDLSVLLQVERRLKESFLRITFEKYHSYNNDALEEMANSDTPTLLMFLGSNIGNFTVDNSIDFLKKVGSALKSGDHFLLGVDRKKDPRRILEAYDDPQGITERFNMNILHRINRELNGEFPIEDFMFYPTYNVERAEVRSYLIARNNISVPIKDLELEVQFKAWEAIHTEVSRKYDQDDLADIAKHGDLKLVNQWTDANEDFWLVLYKKDSSI
jgi:dimethylhistidine N-methyltransferase